MFLVFVVLLRPWKWYVLTPIWLSMADILPFQLHLNAFLQDFYFRPAHFNNWEVSAEKADARPDQFFAKFNLDQNFKHTTGLIQDWCSSLIMKVIEKLYLYAGFKHPFLETDVDISKMQMYNKLLWQSIYFLLYTLVCAKTKNVWILLRQVGGTWRLVWRPQKTIFKFIDP